MASALLSPRLRFAYQPGAFSLSYRASDEPQLLHIDLLATGKVFPFPPAIALSAWIDHANQGFGAGTEFAPARTRVEQVSGRRSNDAGDSMGPVDVVCVSPFYVCNLVDRLSTPSATVDVAHLNISGSLAVDDSPLTVTTNRMKKWLKDRSAYVGRPLTLPFKVTEKAVKRVMRYASRSSRCRARSTARPSRCSRATGATRSRAIRTWPEMRREARPSACVM